MKKSIINTEKKLEAILKKLEHNLRLQEYERELRRFDRLEEKHYRVTNNYYFLRSVSLACIISYASGCAYIRYEPKTQEEIMQIEQMRKDMENFHNREWWKQ